MLHVFLLGYPFEIVDGVVSLVPVLVIYLRLIIRVWDECFGDYSMNARCSAFCVFCEANMSVVLVIRV